MLHAGVTKGLSMEEYSASTRVCSQTQKGHEDNPSTRDHVWHPSCSEHREQVRPRPDREEVTSSNALKTSGVSRTTAQRLTGRCSVPGSAPCSVELRVPAGLGDWPTGWKAIGGSWNATPATRLSTRPIVLDTRWHGTGRESAALEVRPGGRSHQWKASEGSTEVCEELT